MAGSSGKGGAGAEYGCEEVHILYGIKETEVKELRQMLMFRREGQKEEEGDEAVEEEYLEAEGVAEPLGRVEPQHVADDGREDGDVGHFAVVDAAFGEEAEGVEAQQGAVGEARHVENDGYQGVAVERSEGNDYK